MPAAQRANELDPKYALSYVHLATALKSLGRTSEAVRALEQALERQPSIAPWMTELDMLRATLAEASRKSPNSEVDPAIGGPTALPS